MENFVIGSSPGLGVSSLSEGSSVGDSNGGVHGCQLKLGDRSVSFYIKTFEEILRNP